jgi:hypothetical protein
MVFEMTTMLLGENMKDDERIVNYIVNPVEGRSYRNPKKRRDEIIAVVIIIGDLQRQR